MMGNNRFFDAQHIFVPIYSGLTHLLNYAAAP